MEKFQLFHLSWFSLLAALFPALKQAASAFLMAARRLHPQVNPRTNYNFCHNLFKGSFRVEPRVLRSPTVLSRVPLHSACSSWRLHKLMKVILSTIYRDSRAYLATYTSLYKISALAGFLLIYNLRGSQALTERWRLTGQPPYEWA